MLSLRSTTPCVLALVLASGCGLNEHLPQVDISGTVVIPRAAATRTIENPATGALEEVTDARFIGPVYLGAYPDIKDDLFSYPHPEMGPIIDTDLPGNTYPYGGGSVGHFDFACFESTRCKVVTGRYADYNSLLEFHRDSVGTPIVDEFGAEVESEDYYRAYCYNLFEYTADYEMIWLAGEDLDFEENSDGDFEAGFDMWQVTYYPNMKIWGWMDAPNEKFIFSTCDEERGQRNQEYTNDFEYGASYTNLLNYPSLYIHEGDFVVEEPYEATAEDADAFRAEGVEPRLVFSHAVVE